MTRFNTHSDQARSDSSSSRFTRSLALVILLRYTVSSYTHLSRDRVDREKKKNEGIYTRQETQKFGRIGKRCCASRRLASSSHFLYSETFEIEHDDRWTLEEPRTTIERIELSASLQARVSHFLYRTSATQSRYTARDIRVVYTYTYTYI